MGILKTLGSLQFWEPWGLCRNLHLETWEPRPVPTGSFTLLGYLYLEPLLGNLCLGTFTWQPLLGNLYFTCKPLPGNLRGMSFGAALAGL